MQRFERILFSPLGDRRNAAAVRRIAALASAHDASVTALGVVPEITWLNRLVSSKAREKSVRDEMYRSMERKLERCTRGLEGVPIKSDIREGGVALSITAEVLRNEHDLVVVTTDEDQEDHAAIRRLLRKCPCTVWVIRPTRARTQRVLAAVNPEPDEADLNADILSLAMAMHDLDPGELHAAHVWELYGESTMRSSAMLHMPREEFVELRVAEEAEHGRLLDELVTSAGDPDVPCRQHLINGAPSIVIPQLIAKLRVNLLVIGTLARRGVGGLVMGNTAERVLDEVRCSVIAVKPPGFESPIRL